MPREQEDEREDDDESKPKRPVQFVTPALAGLTSIVASTPLLSVSPKKEKVEETEKEVVFERKVIRIPGDDGVIIPLHGDSDDEINPGRYTDPSLVTTETSVDTAVKPKAVRTKVGTKKTKAKSKPESSAATSKLVTPALAGLAAVIAASPIMSETTVDDEKLGSPMVTEPPEHPEVQKRDESKVRTFIVNADGNSGIVPLHGDSDEDLHPDRYTDPSLVKKQLLDGPQIEEFIPPTGNSRNGRVFYESQKEQLPSKIELVEDQSEEARSKPKKGSGLTKESALTKLVTPALAGMTTLLAASPILASSPEETPNSIEYTGEQQGQQKKEIHERKFIRIPNEDNNIIIPLHGDSDEELNPERYTDPSLQGVHLIGGDAVEEIKTMKTMTSERKPVGSTKKSSEKNKKPSSRAKMVTPTLAGMTTLLASSPILSVSPKLEDGNEEETVLDGDTQQENKPLERKYIKTSNNEGFIIPLHGDSDEEIHPERYKDPAMVGVQIIDGPTAEEIHPQMSTDDQKKVSKLVTKKDSKKVKAQAAKIATPLLAGMTTLLAASPLLSSSPKDIKEKEVHPVEKTEEVYGDIDERDTQEQTVAEEQPLERKYISIPNQDGVIIPLHGDSDEELHPERYENPDWVGIQKIEGPTFEQGIPKQLAESDKNRGKGFKAINVIKTSKKAKDQITKVTTPILAGMTTLLAASPILTASPKATNSTGLADDDDSVIKDSPEESDASEDKLDDQMATHDNMPDEKPLERKFITIPNKEGVIIPLHGESDEEIHPERYEDPSMIGVQRIEGPSAVDSPVAEPNQNIQRRPKPTDIKKVAKEAREQLSKVATPLLAGMTTILAASPLLTAPSKEENRQGKGEEIMNSEDAKEMTENETASVVKEETPLERRIIVIPEKEGFIVPLHGDSDEELHPERYEDPSMISIEKIDGPTLQTPPPPVFKSPPKESGFKAFSFMVASKQAKDQVTKVATPLLAGMTTLLAASPILTVSPKLSNAEQEDSDPNIDEANEKFEKIVYEKTEEMPLERKIISVPDKEGFIIPLHGDSDEELHPERYEDPSLISIQRIEGPTLEPIITPNSKRDEVKSKKLTVPNIKQATKKVKETASNVATPLLAGLTTILAASPILTLSSPKKAESDYEKITPPEKTEVLNALGSQEVQNDDAPVLPEELLDEESVAGSVAEEEVPLPLPRKRKITLNCSIAETIEITNTNDDEVKEPMADQLLSDREHEYEPINPQEPPPSPAAQGRLSRRDQAEIQLALEQPAPDETINKDVVPKQELSTRDVRLSTERPKTPTPKAEETSKVVTESLTDSYLPFAPTPTHEEKVEDKHNEVLERKYIRIPNEDKSIIIPLHGDSDEELHPDRYKDPSLQGIQRIEGPVLEHFKPPPKPPRDIASQSEYEPIQNPDKMGVDEDGHQPSLQDRFKAGAGQMRDKLRNIQVPKINLPDRPQMKMPERPQFLKERPQFLKEPPKFLTERPQFLKERPQFLKERPQFLKNKPKFLNERPNFLKERPKFLRERPKFSLPDRTNFKIPERFRKERSPKLDKPKIRRPNPSSLRRPLRDAITISSSSSHNLFETLKARTYPRFLSKKKRDRERAAQLRQQASLETESSQPSSPPDRRKLFPERQRDIKFVDEESGYNDQKMEVQSEEGYEENTAPFHEKYQPTPEQKKMGKMKAKIDSSSDIGESDKEQISSGSGSMKHRRGVLEEIDSDEFFLRQKGLSREDVDVSRYLSKEIRDAFRSPKNALVQMDSTERYDDEYEDEEEDLRSTEDFAPQPPERRSVRSNRSFTGSRESEFNIFPTRPTRRKQSEPEVESSELFDKVKKPPRKYRSRSGTRSSLKSLDRFSRRTATEDAPRPPSRQKSLRSLTRSRPESESDVLGGSALGDIAHDDGMTPVRPLRKSQSRGASVDERTSRGADSLPQDYGEYEQDEEEEDIDGDEVDIDDDELDEDVQEPQVHEHAQVFRAVPINTSVHVRSESFDEEVPGYAVVRKSKPPRPPLPRKSRKEQLQSQLHTIKAHGITFFQTFPRRAMKSLNKPRLPIRSVKTHTMGPVRPPRRNRVFREPVYVDGDLPEDRPSSSFKDYTENKHEYEETRDLQSGEIVEKMKGRPLPAPPRPPRKTKDDESTSENNIEDNIEDDFNAPEDLEEKEVVVTTRLNILGTQEGLKIEENIISEPETPRKVISTTDTSQQTSFEIVDTSVSTQTNPLSHEFTIDEQRDQTSRMVRTGDQPLRNRFVEELMQRSELPDHNQPFDDRRRLFDPEIVRQSEEATREDTPPPLPQRTIPAPPPPIPIIPPVQVSFPDKLHLTQLDVDKLNVNELQANTIKVSAIDGVTMEVSEITSTSGNLILNGVELPPDFIKNLVAQIPIPKQPDVPKPIEIPEGVRETTPQPQLKRILTPPPPIVVQHMAQLASEAPSPPIQQASTTEQLPKPITTRTRRKSPTRVVDDSEEELASVIIERERKERELLEKYSNLKQESNQPHGEKKTEKLQEASALEKPSTSQESPVITTDEAVPGSSNSQPVKKGSDEQPITQATAFQLIKQLVTIWYKDIVSGASSFVQGINSIFPDNDKRRDAQTAALILVIMIASLIILGLGAEQSVHHHHWDYLNPPR